MTARPKSVKIPQRLEINLSSGESAYLIANNQCYYLHHLTPLYEPLVVVIRNKEVRQRGGK